VCPSYACLYSSVLSLLQKPVNVKVRSRTVSGSEFQIEGPEVAKLRDPYHAWSISRQSIAWNCQIVMGSRTEMLTTSCRRHRSAHHVCWVRRRPTTKALEHHRAQLVLNALSHLSHRQISNKSFVLNEARVFVPVADSFQLSGAPGDYIGKLKKSH